MFKILFMVPVLYICVFDGGVFATNHDRIVDDNNNNNVVHYILDPDSTMSIRGDVTIYQAVLDSAYQILGDQIPTNIFSRLIYSIRMFQLRRNSIRNGGYHVYGISYDEPGQGNDQNAMGIGFLMNRRRRDTPVFLRLEGQHRENVVTLQSSIIGSALSYLIFRSDLGFREGGGYPECYYELNMMSNIIEVNYVLLGTIDGLTLNISISEGGATGGIRGVGNYPQWRGADCMLNIMLDENSITNMELGRHYPVVYGFDLLEYSRIRLLNNIPGLIGDFDGNGNYVISLIDNRVEDNNNENTTPLTITVEDNRVEEVEDNNENNNENINMHTVITNNARDNSNDTSYGHFDNSTVIEDEEEDEDDEELNIVPSPTLNNNINIIPTPNNNNLPNNMGIGSTFGGRSGF